MGTHAVVVERKQLSPYDYEVRFVRFDGYPTYTGKFILRVVNVDLPSYCLGEFEFQTNNKNKALKFARSIHASYIYRVDRRADYPTKVLFQEALYEGKYTKPKKLTPEICGEVSV